MKRALFLALLLSLTSVSLAQSPDAVSPDSKFVAPTIQEFYVPIQTGTTVIGALFGAMKKQNQEIEQYWYLRDLELKQQNAKCFALQGDEYIRECLSNVRQSEIRKSQLLVDRNQQMNTWTQNQAAYSRRILED